MATKSELTPRESGMALQQALMGDARLCLKAGMSPEEWRKRILLLSLYSLPPEHVEHRQVRGGHWLHRIHTRGEGGHEL